MNDFEENALNGEEKDENIEVAVNTTDESGSVEKMPKPKKRLSIFSYLNKMFDVVLRTFARFPLAIIFFIALAVIFIYRIEVTYEKLRGIDEYLNRITSMLILGIPLSLSIDLLFERFFKNISLVKRLASYIVELGLLTLYYLFVLTELNMATGLRLTCLTFALLLAFFFTPYLLKKENFEIYITRLDSRLAVSIFFTVVLGTGISATLFAVKALLYNNMDTKLFAYAWIVSWLVFAPIHFLYGLPDIEDEFSIEHYNKVLKVLLLYIVMPLIAVYTLVLYIYFGKIIFTRVWPDGIVSNLVLSYAAVGIATVFLVTPLKTLSSWVRYFASIYSKLIFPLLAMMFVSIGIRIGQFGVTENRYLIVTIGIWATLAMIYVNFDKGKRNIMLPISLAVIAIIAVVGPLSAFNISVASQNHRFYNILVKNDMLSEGKFVKSSIISSSDKKEIMGILWYFNNSHSLKDLKYLPADFNMQKTEEILGFKQEGIKYNNYFNYNTNPIFALPITDYDGLFKIQVYKSSWLANNLINDQEILSGKKKIRATVDKSYTFTLYSDGAEIYKKDLSEFAEVLYAKYGTKYHNFTPQDLTLSDGNNNVNLKFVFSNINGIAQSDGNGVEINYIDAYVLVRVKG